MLKRLIIPILFLTCIYSQNKTLVKKTEIVEDTRTVIATGVGVDRDQAVEDGLRNAVEQAIGVYLKSTTIVENYQAIDKLLTHSRGYVQEYDILTERAEPPLYRIKLSAVVIVRELKASLLELNLYTKEIEGKSLFAAAMTKVNATQQGLRLLEDIFEGYPRNAIIIDYGEPEIKTGATDMVDVYFPTTISWNMDFINDYKEIIDQISLDNIPWRDDAYEKLKKLYVTDTNNENSELYFAGSTYFLNNSLKEFIRLQFSGKRYRDWKYPRIQTELYDINKNTIKSKKTKIMGFDQFRFAFPSARNYSHSISAIQNLTSSSDVSFTLTLNEMNRIVAVSGYSTK